MCRSSLQLSYLLRRQRCRRRLRRRAQTLIRHSIGFAAQPLARRNHTLASAVLAAAASDSDATKDSDVEETEGKREREYIRAARWRISATKTTALTNARPTQSDVAKTKIDCSGFVRLRRSYSSRFDYYCARSLCLAGALRCHCDSRARKLHCATNNAAGSYSMTSSLCKRLATNATRRSKKGNRTKRNETKLNGVTVSFRFVSCRHLRLLLTRWHAILTK